jgi:hypothetical protein
LKSNRPLGVPREGKSRSARFMGSIEFSELASIAVSMSLETARRPVVGRTAPCALGSVQVDDRHPVPRQRSGLVGTENRCRAERLDRRASAREHAAARDPGEHAFDPRAAQRSIADGCDR